MVLADGIWAVSIHDDKSLPYVTVTDNRGCVKRHPRFRHTVLGVNEERVFFGTTYATAPLDSTLVFPDLCLYYREKKSLPEPYRSMKPTNHTIVIAFDDKSVTLADTTGTLGDNTPFTGFHFWTMKRSWYEKEYRPQKKKKRVTKATKKKILQSHMAQAAGAPAKEQWEFLQWNKKGDAVSRKEPFHGTKKTNRFP